MSLPWVRSNPVLDFQPPDAFELPLVVRYERSIERHGVRRDQHVVRADRLAAAFQPKAMITERTTSSGVALSRCRKTASGRRRIT